MDSTSAGSKNTKYIGSKNIGIAPYPDQTWRGRCPANRLHRYVACPTLGQLPHSIIREFRPDRCIGGQCLKHENTKGQGVEPRRHERTKETKRKDERGVMMYG